MTPTDSEDYSAGAQPIPVPHAAVPEVCQALAKALAEAEEGKIRSLAMALVAEGGAYRTVFVGEAWMTTLAGVVGNMLHRMNLAMDRKRGL